MDDKMNFFKNEISNIENINCYDEIRKNCSLLRKTFLEFYNMSCAYCGVSISPENKIVNFEIDHIYPRKFHEEKSKTGGYVDSDYIAEVENVNCITNLAASCSFCNNKKSNKLLLKNFHPDYADYSEYIKIERCEFKAMPREGSGEEIKHLFSVLCFDHDKRFHINAYCECIALLKIFKANVNSIKKNAEIIMVFEKIIQIYDDSILFKTLLK